MRRQRTPREKKSEVEETGREKRKEQRVSPALLFVKPRVRLGICSDVAGSETIAA